MTNKDLVDRLIKYENGLMNHGEQVSLLQELVNTGMVWQLQGSYGRAAKHALDAGWIKPPPRRGA